MATDESVPAGVTVPGAIAAFTRALRQETERIVALLGSADAALAAELDAVRRDLVRIAVETRETVARAEAILRDPYQLAAGGTESATRGQSALLDLSLRIRQRTEAIVRLRGRLDEIEARHGTLVAHDPAHQP